MGGLRAVAQATTDENLPPGTHHRGKQDTLAWTLKRDRLKIVY